MRILHVVASMDPAFGGPPVVASRLAAAQAGLGHQVAIAFQDSLGQAAAIDASLRDIPGIDAVAMAPLPAGLRLGMMVPAATARLLGAGIAAADIVHLHGVWDRVVWRASIEARRLGVPYILAPHGMLDPWSLRQRWLKKKIALMLTYRGMLEQAACLHVLNADEARLLGPLGLRTPRRVLPNGVFPAEIEPLPPKGAFRAAHPELEDQPFVLFLSRLHYKKGLDYLADAFIIVAANDPAIRLVVAGPDAGARADFERRITSTGLRDRVHIVGPLWGRQKIAAYVDAACFCLPSRQEGFSMAILESLACATPVVISDACHFPEVAEARAGDVVTLNAKALAEALVGVLTDPERRASMGEAGRSLVLSRFTWPAIAQRSIQVFEDVLQGRLQATG
ncbi:MAG: hypothetical protein DMD54_01150 [Gemmatimonadetes bacterium]|nr:MAG: hypothetical protein DMD54_01150 [Gemmatimonadota bacterium]